MRSRHPRDGAPLPTRAGGRGRYAPSPTGALHLGNARTALIAWLAARAQRASFVLRIEDLDRARIVPGAEQALMDDLRWLGIDWDEGPDCGGRFGPYRQSERQGFYEATIRRLLADGRVFSCACSRADVARAASAPHAADEEGPRYPGTCRALPPGEAERIAARHGRGPTIRFQGRGERIAFADEVHGAVEPLGAGGLDDFVLRRADGVFAYQLAVVVDDLAMEIDEIVRGDDLLTSTPRQLALYRALGAAREPRFAHVPLLLSPDGEKVAKRRRPVGVASLRAAGADPRDVVGRLALSAGLLDRAMPCLPAELVESFSWARLRREPVVWDSDPAA